MSECLKEVFTNDDISQNYCENYCGSIYTYEFIYEDIYKDTTLLLYSMQWEITKIQQSAYSYYNSHVRRLWTRYYDLGRTFEGIPIKIPMHVL